MRGDLSSAAGHFNRVETQIEQFYKKWIEEHQDESGISEFPYNTTKLMNEGLHLTSLGKYKEALDTFRDAMAEGEMTPELANNIAVCAMNCNQIKRAIECLESFVKASP